MNVEKHNSTQNEMAVVLSNRRTVQTHDTAISLETAAGTSNYILHKGFSPVLGQNFHNLGATIRDKSI